jgi:hypothetical protein
VIPRGVRFIAGSAFRNVKLSSISIESGNERFVIRGDLLIDIVDHKLIRNLSRSPSVIIPCDVEILGSGCFSSYESLECVTFESNSRLMRIESHAFSISSLQSILMTTRIKRMPPPESDRITIPSAVLFVAHDASPNPSQLSLCDEDSCPDFGRWRRLRQSDTAVDFRRIVRGGARLRLDLTGFEEGCVIVERSGLYRRAKD